MTTRIRKEHDEFARFTEMTKRQLVAETALYDEEFSADQFGPLDAESRKDWKRFKRRVGRPRVGEGAVRVSVSLERGLLKAVDHLAKELAVKRAELIAEALLKLIATEPLAGKPPSSRAKKDPAKRP
jgi:hypothetical protein